MFSKSLHGWIHGGPRPGPLASAATPQEATASGAEAGGEHRVGGAQALRFAAGGAAGAVAVVPGVDVEVRPRLTLGHEALEVERRDDAAAHLRGTGVRDVGDIAGEVAQVRPPQR